jgi:hypothetical protein
LLAITSKTFIAQPDAVFARTQDYLGLSAWQPNEYKISTPGEYEQVRAETGARLMKYFAPYNQQLYAFACIVATIWRGEFNSIILRHQSRGKSPQGAPFAPCIGRRAHGSLTVVSAGPLPSWSVRFVAR